MIVTEVGPKKEAGTAKFTTGSVKGRHPSIGEDAAAGGSRERRDMQIVYMKGGCIEVKSTGTLFWLKSRRRSTVDKRSVSFERGSNTDNP